MTKKTAQDYAADIIQIHSDLQRLPEYHPDVEKLIRQLSSRVSSWQALLDITHFIASNESIPWELEDCHTEPMPLKSKTGYNQVCDYIYLIKNTCLNQSSDVWGLLCIERKTKEDAYGTLMNRDGRDRFYREIAKYEADDRFNQMLIIVECTLADFLSYTPKFNGKRYNKNHIGASVESRRATVAGLYARGVPVLWAGSRIEAQKTYLQLVRQSIIKSYKSILNLE